VNGQDGTKIGHSDPKGRNIISGNGNSGIEFDQGGGADTSIQDNYIGTNKDGAAKIPNTGGGVVLHGANGVAIGGAKFPNADGGLGNLRATSSPSTATAASR
jgi:hypothetical protein